MKVLLALVPWWVWAAGGVAATVALALFVGHVRTLEAHDKASQACVAAVAGKPGAKGVTEVCSETIAAAAIAASQARSCDAQLQGLKAGAPAVCSAPVRALAGARDIAAGELANAKTDLASARSEADAAVARAVTRQLAADKRATTAGAAIAAAPRQPDGTLDLDADRICLITACPGATL